MRPVDRDVPDARTCADDRRSKTEQARGTCSESSDRGVWRLAWHPCTRSHLGNLNLWHARRFLKQIRQPAAKPWSASTAADGVANASTAVMKAFQRMMAVPVALPMSSQHVGLNSSQYLRQTPPKSGGNAHTGRGNVKPWVTI